MHEKIKLWDIASNQYLVAIWFYWTGMGEELLNRISDKFMEERGDKSLLDAAVRKFKRGRER